MHEPGEESPRSIDLAGPFPADKHGNTYIVVVVDTFSRFVTAEAVKSTKAEETDRCDLWTAIQPQVGQRTGSVCERTHHDGSFSASSECGQAMFGGSISCLVALMVLDFGRVINLT